jgi:predicted ATPase/signal transduction histidine kinase
MITLKGYQIKEKIHESATTLVYRGRRLADEKPADEQPVVIKLLKAEYPTFRELVQFRNQYAIALNFLALGEGNTAVAKLAGPSDLDLPGVAVPIAMENYRNGFALVMEDYGGISLKNYTDGKCLNLDEFFPLAISLAKTLEGLELNRIIHKDIKPSNILINPTTKEVKLIDFSIASLLPRETQEIQNPNVLEGTLAYISPEQTGRMNRGIDYRADFYGLGVTFYELLAGELPFKSNDPLELVHCHIAKMPTALEDIPGVLSDIVLKLMAKNAEERYQTARGIRHDLEICWQQWQETGSIASFSLGTRDLSDRFLIPEKLYGRETEIETLLAAFERVSENATEMMLVTGFSGIGKTAVVSEVHKPIVRQRGYFIKGKFDQFQRNIPFSAFAQAFSSLMGQLLAESEASLQKWKEKILAALGENGRVIIDVIPELEGIIGKQPPVTELSARAAQNRFNLLFGKFVGAIATAEHPLVIFLDDLQWADSASLKLMQLLTDDGDTPHLLLIGAYRDNEVNPTHPLMLTLDEIAKSGATVNRITLAPLNLDALNRLVADTLRCPLERSLPLTELVHRKTGGNPFFSNQFLKSLHADGSIYFDFDAGCWQCDIAKVRELSLTDDVVEFMALQLEKLPESTRNLLKLAACIGNQFDLGTLAIVSEKTPEETTKDLWLALKEGLILPLSETYKFYQQENTHSPLPITHYLLPKYKFLHDRVQQAAYSLIPEEEKKTVHLKIGQLLLRNTKEEEREEKIFDLVNQLNYGVDLIATPAEREQLAQLNLIAGGKAQAATAYTAALEYLTTGQKLLAADCWQSQYELALAIYEAAAEAAYLGTEFEKMEQWVEIVLQQGKTLLDAVKVYEVKIQASMAQNQPLAGIATALPVLRQLGVELPESPQPEDIERGLAETASLLAGKQPEELIELPEMTSPEKLAALRILSKVVPTAYVAAPQLLPLIVLQQVNLSIKHGNAADSAFAYANYGQILCGAVGDLEKGYQFGKVALEVLSRLNARSLFAKTFVIVYFCIAHWREHLLKTLKPFQEAFAIGQETGDIEYGAYAALNYGIHSYLTGRELAELSLEMENYTLQFRQLKQETALNYHEIFRQGVLNLLGFAEENPWQLIGEAYNEKVMLPVHQSVNDSLAIAHVSTNKLLLAYLFGEYDLAVENAELVGTYLNEATAFAGIPIYYFYDSLARLAVCPKVESQETTQETQETGFFEKTGFLKATQETRFFEKTGFQSQILEKVAAKQKKMRKWADNAPMNYLHKFYLVEAERHRVLGEKLEAIEFYDRAIAGAKENGYIQEEALANELAAKFYLEWGKETIAEAYLTKAYYGYARWGAKAKVEDLEQRYTQYLVPILSREQSNLTVKETISRLTTGTVTATNTSSTSTVLDLATVIKASLAISGEIELGNLLSTLMQVVMENAGAQTGALVLLKEENPMLVVRCINGNCCNLVSQTPVTAEEAPLSLVNYVRRTKETVVIKNAAKDKTWARAPYIVENQPLSVLCSPIINRGKAIAVLYLENNLIPGAFTSDRQEILNILCSQAAVSLENAQLYQQSQDYAQKLERSLQQLQEAQLQLVQGEKMAAIGQLAAGIAHEINNPVGFISGNLEPARDYLQDLINLINLYQQYYPEPAGEIVEEIEAIDLEYLLEDLPELIDSMQEGTERIAEISRSMRTFSRSDTASKVPFNIHDGINSTMTILKHRLKANQNSPEIQLVKNYGDLPEVQCYPGQLNQVFMNLTANAIDALEELNLERNYQEIKDNPNCITITTEAVENGSWVAIKIKDNGRGMSEEVKQKVFENLFTTKPPGKGTGLGLSISRSIVVEKHGGRLTCVSEAGKGAEFIIEIPINGV